MPESPWLAFVFPGQGSQKVGMGRDLIEGDSDARSAFLAAETASGAPLTRLCADGPEEALTDTRNAQPAIAAVSLAAAAAYRSAGGPAPAVAAGHSLGEYSALIFSDALDPDSGMRLVRRRGDLMSQAVARKGGAMAAVLGLDADAVGMLCAVDGGIVGIANLNAPGQVVISGEADAVERVGTAAREQGAKAVKPLPVSGAFHSALMRDAADALAGDLSATYFRLPRIPIYANVTARPVEDAASLPRLLTEQIVSHVRWTETVQGMVSAGAKAFVEIGPGKVLCGLIRRIAPEAALFNVEDRESLDKTLAGLDALGVG